MARGPVFMGKGCDELGADPCFFFLGVLSLLLSLVACSLSGEMRHTDTAWLTCTC